VDLGGAARRPAPAGDAGVPWDGEAGRAAAESRIEAEAFDDADRASAPRAAAALVPALRTAVDELRRTLHADAVDSGRRVGRWR
jgi:hypothetical protein